MPETKFASRRILPAFEWMAENAYIPPGLHRLLAAGGLAVGLWGGRSFMDIVVARDHKTGAKIDREHVPQLFRPLHGIMAYNQYSDASTERWKSVVDKFIPAAVGSLVAYYGGKMYFHGKAPAILGGKALHPLSNAARENLAAVMNKLPHGKMSSHTVEILSGSAQADALRGLAAGTYGAGATIGTDKAGGFFFGNHNMWADSFAVGANIKSRFPVPNIPVLREAVTWLNRFGSGNRSTGSVGAPRAMRAAATWAQGNIYTHETLAWMTPRMLRKWAIDGLQDFTHVSEAQIHSVSEHMRDVITRAHHAVRGDGQKGILAAEKIGTLYKEIAGDLHRPGFIEQGMDRLLNNAGADWSKFNPGDNGVFSAYARGLGSASREQPGRAAFKKYAVENGFNNAHLFDDAAPKLSHRQAVTLWGSVAGGLASTFAIGSYAAARINKRATRTQDANGNDAIATSQYTPPKVEKNDTILSWINGVPLDMMQWASRMVIVPPSMHRLMSAGYLSAALYGGMKLADAMTGRKLPLLRGGPLSNSVLEKSAIKGIWTPLRAVHGMLAYTPGSSLAADRWRMAAHYLIPVAFGAAGTYAGSALYFKDRFKKLETPEHLEDYVDKIAMEQSKPFAGLTAITSIFNTGSGIHLLPVFNYSANLQSRYVLGAGLQVATPGLGKWWSGNAGLTPWGIKKTLAYIGNYLGQNPDPRPRELPALVHSVLAKLYPEMPENELLLKKREFLHAIHEVRDSYFVEGAVPPTKREALSTQMRQLVVGEGFENLLVAAGFDPTHANLASNGASGAIANALGKRGKVAKLQDEYHHKFAERLTSKATLSPHETLQRFADHATAVATAANDNPPLASNDNPPLSHAERVRQARGEQKDVELG